MQDLHKLSEELKLLSAQEGLELLAKQFASEITFSTSFGLEDQVITEMIAQKIKRRFSMFMGEDDVDVGKDNKFSSEETRFSITYNMVNPLLNEWIIALLIVEP